MEGLAGKITSSLHESNFACYNYINGITSTADEYNFPSYNCMYKQHNNMWEGRGGRLRRNSYGDARIVRGIRLDTVLESLHKRTGGFTHKSMKNRMNDVFR